MLPKLLTCCSAEAENHGPVPAEDIVNGLNVTTLPTAGTVTLSSSPENLRDSPHGVWQGQEKQAFEYPPQGELSGLARSSSWVSQSSGISVIVPAQADLTCPCQGRTGLRYAELPVSAFMVCLH